MNRAILAVNSGSSSIKFALYRLVQRELGEVILSGLAEGLEPGGQPRATLRYNGEQYALTLLAEPVTGDAFHAMLTLLREQIGLHSDGAQIVAVAHRVVHGGERCADSVVVDETMLTYLRSLHHLAPLHQPHNLDGVDAFRAAFPDCLHVACFDTGFHAQMPEQEYRFALPAELSQQGIRRYGFHGLSYRYVASHLAQVSARAGQHVIMAHLGNGASLCAMRQGISVATTMGFSALDGLMMGSRCGALDPGVLLHLLQDGWDAKRIESTLYKQSGLLGVSGVSADMRSLRASSDPRAALAIRMFAYRILRECGALTAVLGGIDAIAFTGGIGEHDVQLRADVISGLHYLGLRLDPAANQAADGNAICAIHSTDSSAEIWVIPTDEGRIAAQDAARLLAGV
ncbi:acetate/propionate family kinase [Undibacterium rugosum]|uniref:acetate/propionate family kinase n=1 Tax=Undibacterium rugosum TaxID=2762291 RepID=UPI001B825E54|nr:acetate/propionate family kinase [Undibacterium rugosum]MBR7776972.1 acetate/propionate family kinase [Undibacterium rugosum]